MLFSNQKIGEKWLPLLVFLQLWLHPPSISMIKTGMTYNYLFWVFIMAFISTVFQRDFLDTFLPELL